MKTKKQAAEIVALLKTQYEVAPCSLSYEQGWQLMVAVRLAAQCTDVRVNIVTQELFAKYPTLKALSEAAVADIERIVKPCGVYKMKAKDISLATKKLINEYGGILPDDIDTLLKFPGIGRKSANLIVGDIYGKPAIVADTHCIRISNRLGFINNLDPAKVEFALREVVEPMEGSDLCHRFVFHGREVCTARKPYCERCVLTKHCDYFKNIK